MMIITTILVQYVVPLQYNLTGMDIYSVWTEIIKECSGVFTTILSMMLQRNGLIAEKKANIDF